MLASDSGTFHDNGLFGRGGDQTPHTLVCLSVCVVAVGLSGGVCVCVCVCVCAPLPHAIAGACVVERDSCRGVPGALEIDQSV